ncbi:hypothetical protein KAM429_39680 [Aquipseudomonas alcaligenes]|nr:hypothetical protein KAM426_36520 [Pseudomonas alcaligenes]BDS26080.1 hypothetical protein KAM576c_26990 [Enterobacter asburiae]GIZ68855.1 hypothetical protein KAM428_39400 [Pseudomonas alcaligenes]GIZ73207.1 hypothetical protein KAM429_39680 [Pseudomonas alcaligenes]GIZ77582.1 hypothetical protein KAM430_39910 [Pseudomonas alcaligenes]
MAASAPCASARGTAFPPIPGRVGYRAPPRTFSADWRRGPRTLGLLSNQDDWIEMEHAEFDAAFAQLPEGYSEGAYEGRRFGVTVRRSGDGRRNSLFARELAGTDIVSFNLYRVTSDRTLLKPCEMSAEKVVAFVLDFRPAP